MNILDKIITDKKREVELKKSIIPVSQLEASVLFNSRTYSMSKLLKIASISPNLGDTRTIITHPASTTHSKLPAEEKAALGITDGLVRVAVGLESIEDLKADFLQALNQIS